MEAATKPKPTVGQYRYRLATTGGNSAKYGNCEVCDQPCTEVFSQQQSRYYEFEGGGVYHSGWTRHKCHLLFGHKECLISKQIPNEYLANH